MAMKQAANSPAPGLHSSFVRKYVEIAVSPLENKNVPKILEVDKCQKFLYFLGKLNLPKGQVGF